MANEITWASISSDAQRAIVVSEILGIQTDQNYITNHPAMIDVGDVAAAGSDTVTMREDNLNGAASFTTIAEGGTYSNAAYDVNKFSVAVADYYDQWNLSDLALMVAADGEFDAARFALNAMKKEALTWTDLLAIQLASFSAVHTMTAAATVEDLVIAQQKLELVFNDGSIKLAVLKPEQFHEVQLDAAFQLALNNAMEDPEVKAMSRLIGGTYKGRFGTLDVYTSSKVTTSAGKYQGGIFSRGGILRAYGTPVAQVADEVLMGRVLMGRYRSQTKPETLIRSKTFMGVAIGQQAAGIRFASPT